MMTQEQLRIKLKEIVPLVEKTAKLVAVDEDQEPVDPDMLLFWKTCLANQYTLQLYLNHLNASETR